MKISGNKINYKHVRLTWWDICQSEEAWIHEDDVLKHDIAICTDTGYIFKKTKTKLWLFTSFSEDKDGLSVGGLTCFPIGCVKKIEYL
tara:strand:- start:79 stop:342 length:264 start_codon:yes stop_codon:yes gene_type:complete